MKLLNLCALSSLLASDVIGELVTWSCKNSPMACENFCYATTCRGVPNEYQKHNRGPGASDENRRASGAKFNPCNDARRNTYWCQQYGKCHVPPIPDMQADEWPAARLVQGGVGAWLRCINKRDNQSRSIMLSRVNETHRADSNSQAVVRLGSMLKGLIASPSQIWTMPGKWKTVDPAFRGCF